MKIHSKEEALECLGFLVRDFEMLRDGEWDGDADSCEASIDVLFMLTDFVKERVNES